MPAKSPVKSKNKTIKKKEEGYWEAVGRRKTAIARVRLYKKSGDFLVNAKPYKEYFSIPEYQAIFEQPLKRTKVLDKISGTLKVKGGGKRGQVEAARLGLARALVVFNPDWRSKLKKGGLLTRDARVKERKKYGLKKARRAPQWSKR